MEKVQIIPPPKEVDPRVLAWKGAAVLGKMDGVADLWLTASDWVRDSTLATELFASLMVCRISWACAVSKRDVSICRTITIHKTIMN
jgi:hypothetical protein